jgi:hypothetical protein
MAKKLSSQQQKAKVSSVRAIRVGLSVRTLFGPEKKLRSSNEDRSLSGACLLQWLE